MIEYLAYAQASAFHAASLANSQAQMNASFGLRQYDPYDPYDPSMFGGLQNAYRTLVQQRDRWMCEDLGIPNIPEDTQ